MSNPKTFLSRHVFIALAVAVCQTIPTAWLGAMAADGVVRMGGSQVFSVGSSAGGYSAEQRAQIIQRNLDNALVASADKSASAVGLTYVKGAPVITLGGYYIATVDANSASLSI